MPKNPRLPPLNPTQLKVRQVITQKSEAGSTVDSTKKEYDALDCGPLRDREINFSVRTQLVIAPDDGATTTVQTFINCWVNKTQSLREQEVTIERFDMGEHAKDGIFAYKAKW